MTTQTHAVVAGFDGSEPSLLALEYAADEAARRLQPLRIVTGLDLQLLGTTGMPLDDSVIEPVRGMLDDAAGRARSRQPELDVTSEVILGSPAGVLVEESERASVVVVGNRGRGGFASLLAGSVATQLATHAQSPVIVVRPGTDPAAAATRPVVVGVDGFERTEAAVEFAFEEASSRGVPLTAVHVWIEPPRSGDDEFKPVTHDYDEARKAAGRLLAEALAGFQDKYPDVPVTRELICDLDPTHHLLRATEEAGLVVVGSRGRGEFSGFVLGSLGQKLVHHAKCPVAVVRGAVDTDRS